MGMSDDEIKQIVEKYKKKLKVDLSGKSEKKKEEVKTPISREYIQFKNEIMPSHLNFYERACNISESLLKIKPDKKTGPEMQEAINICHLNITPAGAASFAILAPLIIALVGGMLSFLLFGSLENGLWN